MRQPWQIATILEQAPKLAQEWAAERQERQQRTQETLEALHSQLSQTSPTQREGVIQIVLSAIARHRVGTRPDRYEPRVCKRRPKPYPLMRVPRQQARGRLAKAA